MGKKKHAVQTGTVAGQQTPASSEVPPVVAPPVTTATTTTTTTTAVAPEPPKTKQADQRVFTLRKADFTPGKGLATERHAVRKSLGSATVQQAPDALLASGAYQKVAPQAAKLRPLKPVETLLREWLAKGVVDAG